jgi:hypothetical protein
MKALIAHDTLEALVTANRRSKSVRTAHRLLAIWDIMLGRSRKWVRAYHGRAQSAERYARGTFAFVSALPLVL